MSPPMRGLLGHASSQSEIATWKGVAVHLEGLGRQPSPSGVAAMAARGFAKCHWPVGLERQAASIWEECPVGTFRVKGAGSSKERRGCRGRQALFLEAPEGSRKLKAESPDGAA